MKPNRNIVLTTTAIVLAIFNFVPLRAQTADTAKKAGFKPNGKVWGYVFGDYAYKGHADSLKRGATSYSALPKDFNSFNIRRAYLGYDFNISERFSTTIVLAHESGIESNTTTDPSLTSDSKRSVYIKYANLTWKNIIPRANLVIGQQVTPTFATLSEKVWGYRSIEKTIADMRSPLTASSSTDLGVGLFGKFDKNENFGYDVMIGNGSSARLETNNFKKIYTSLYAYLWDKKIVIQANYDYDRTSIVHNYHQSKTMLKAFVAYQSEPLTIGLEAYMETLENNERYSESTSTVVDTTNQSSIGLSIFVRGRIIKDKLGFFTRYDFWSPDENYNNNNTYISGSSPDNEQFITAGLDYMPHKNVHIMPNVWFDSFTDRAKNVTGRVKNDYDLVARVTFYYVFK